MSQMQGHGPIDPDDLTGSAGRVGLQFLLNATMFSAAKLLNTAFGALGTRLAGAETSGANYIRGGGVGLSFLAVGLLQQISSGQIPEGRNLAAFLYENILTMALLEVGGRMVNPMMQDVGIWARARRSGWGLRFPSIRSAPTFTLCKRKLSNWRTTPPLPLPTLTN